MQFGNTQAVISCFFLLKVKFKSSTSLQSSLYCLINVYVYKTPSHWLVIYLLSQTQSDTNDIIIVFSPTAKYGGLWYHEPVWQFTLWIQADKNAEVKTGNGGRAWETGSVKMTGIIAWGGVKEEWKESGRKWWEQAIYTSSESLRQC